MKARLSIVVLAGAAILVFAAQDASAGRYTGEDHLINQLLTASKESHRESAAKALSGSHSPAALQALQYAAQHDRKGDVRKHAQRSADSVQSRLLAMQLTSHRPVHTPRTSTTVVYSRTTTQTYPPVRGAPPPPTVVYPPPASRHPIYRTPSRPCPPPVVVVPSRPCPPKVVYTPPVYHHQPPIHHRPVYVPPPPVRYPAPVYRSGISIVFSR